MFKETAGELNSNQILPDKHIYCWLYHSCHCAQRKSWRSKLWLAWNIHCCLAQGRGVPSIVRGCSLTTRNTIYSSVFNQRFSDDEHWWQDVTNWQSRSEVYSSETFLNPIKRHLNLSPHTYRALDIIKWTIIRGFTGYFKDNSILFIFSSRSGQFVHMVETLCLIGKCANPTQIQQRWWYWWLWWKCYKIFK